MLLFGFFRQIQNGKKWFWTSFKSVISFLLFPKRNIFIRKCKAVTLPWKQLYGLYNQNKNPSILTYSYKQQTFEYISRLNDHVRDSRIWNSEGLPSNTWCNAKQIYRAGLHQQKLSTVVLPNNQPLQNGMNNRKILNNQEKNKQINKKNWNTLKETYSLKKKKKLWWATFASFFTLNFLKTILKNNLIFITFVVVSTLWYSSNTCIYGLYLFINQYPVLACTKWGASISKVQKLAQIFNPLQL